MKHNRRLPNAAYFLFLQELSSYEKLEGSVPFKTLRLSSASRALLRSFIPTEEANNPFAIWAVIGCSRNQQTTTDETLVLLVFRHSFST
jgi:hypothetical protein